MFATLQCFKNIVRGGNNDEYRASLLFVVVWQIALNFLDFGNIELFNISLSLHSL